MTDKVDSPLFEGIAQKDILIRGEKSKSPGFYLGVNMMLAVFSADLKMVKSLLPSKRFKPLSLLPGRALIGINCFQYKTSDVGAYNEVSIAAAVQVDNKAPGFVAVAGSSLKQEYHAYILQLPVNTEFALHGGLDYFNYPKFLAEIKFEETESTRSCSVFDQDSGQLIYAFHGDKLKTSKYNQEVVSKEQLDICTFYGYPIMDGNIMQATYKLNQIEKASKWFGNGFRIEIGNHEKSKLLAKLKPGKLMQYTYLPEGEGILYEPKSLGLAGD